MLDYRTLPFISSQSPYLESLRPDRQVAPEGVSGRDVEFVVYGWSRAPIYASGTSVWPLPDAVLRAAGRVARRRSGPRSTATTRRFRVYFLSDRGGIYALGYPVITWFGHLINLAELMMLAGVLYVGCWSSARRSSTRSTSRTPASGRALLREVRSSFYRKLFLAFVAGAVVPVVILAIATRTYFADAVRTPASRRPRRGRRPSRSGWSRTTPRCSSAAPTRARRASTIRSWCWSAARSTGRQPVRPRPPAGDERARSVRVAAAAAAHARRRLPRDRARSAADLRRRSRRSATVRYLLAAAPVRAGGREGIVTVPLTLRQQEIEQQIDELDRRVLFGAVLFSLLGAGARLLDGRAHRRSGQPADARDAAHRARRSRRAHRRHVVRRTAAAGRGLQPDGRRPEAPARASSSARSASRRGPTWRGRSRTTSRTR